MQSVFHSLGDNFPDADGEDVGNRNRASRSYASSGYFYTGLYLGGSANPHIFVLDNKGYAEYSSIYQRNMNSGENIQITYQTLDANTGSTLSGKNLSGLQSSGKVTLTTLVQKQKEVNGYLYNFTGNATEVSGNFNY